MDCDHTKMRRYPAVVAALAFCVFSGSLAFAPQRVRCTERPLFQRPSLATGYKRHFPAPGFRRRRLPTDKRIRPRSRLNGSPVDDGKLDDEERQGANGSKCLPGAEHLERVLMAPWVEVSGNALVLASSFLVAIATLPLTPFVKDCLEVAQDFIVGLFSFEFFARWYASWKRLGVWGYLTQPLVQVDLFVVILPLFLPYFSAMPPWIPSQSVLINLRLLRIIRLQRVLKDMDTFRMFVKALGLPFLQSTIQPYQLQLARFVLSVYTLLSVSTGLIFTAEHGVNPQMDNYFTALYFGMVTLTTVGFGDITPVTFLGKLVVCASILAGVAIIPAQAAALVEALLTSEKQKELEIDSDRRHSIAERKLERMPPITSAMPSSAIDAVRPCPSCGASFHWTEASYCWKCGTKLEDTVVKSDDSV